MKNNNKKICKDWFIELQNLICKAVLELEKEYGSTAKFKKNKWSKGEYRTIEGNVIEKGGVAFSNVIGKFPKDFAKQIPGTKKNKNFWSSGVSVVLHPVNPKVPALHFNTRHIITSKSWFGGGIDATPCLEDKILKKNFHSKLKNTCDKHSKNYYPKYKKWCDEYFYMPHRKEIRGIGGIFFDYKMNDWNNDFNFVKDIGLTFVEIVKEVVRKKMFEKFTKKQKEIQLLKRGRYVEYNLSLIHI